MKIRVTVQTRFFGSKDEREFEIPDEALADLNAKQQASIIEADVFDVALGMIEWSWEEVNEKVDKST